MTFWKDSISLELIQINHSPHEDFMPEKDGDNMISYKRNMGAGRPRVVEMFCELMPIFEKSKEILYNLLTWFRFK